MDMKSFIDRWLVTAIGTVEILISIVAEIGCMLYAPGVFRVMGVISMITLAFGLWNLGRSMFSKHPPMTAEEALAETFSEYKRDEEDRA